LLVAKKKEISQKKKKEKKKSSLRSETKKGILGIVFFTLAILSLLSFFKGAGIFGEYFFDISRFLFGRGFFLVTLIFALAGLAILVPRFSFKKKEKPIYKTILIGILIFLFSVLGLFHLVLGGGALETESFSQSLKMEKAGGYIGLIAGYPLVKYFGFWASLIIFLAALIISVLITFNIPLRFAKEKNEDKIDKNEPDFQNSRELLAEKPEKKSFWQGFKEKATQELKKEKTAEDFSRPVLREEATEDKEINLSQDNIKTEKFRKDKGGFKLPPVDLLEKERGKPTTGDIKSDINIIKRTLGNFGIEVEMSEVNIGPTVTQYTLKPAEGVKLSKITSLQNDLALALAAHPLRLEAPIPGRSLVGIEVPNRSVVLVRVRNLIEGDSFQKSTSRLVLALGRDAAGNPVVSDLARMPHLLVAGATGTGKTIALNNLIISLIYRNFPEDLKLILIDPKRVEFSIYDGIPHLLTPVITQGEKAVGALGWAVSEMERRFEVLEGSGDRNIESYNNNNGNLPYIVIIIDELADLMGKYGREVESRIVRLAQMARAVGIHLIVSTQRPSVEVITGLIKANITSRIAFQVASQIDSRTVLDMGGADKLLGNGDMLFLAGDSAKPRRIQGAYVSDTEVKKVVSYLKEMQIPEYDDELDSSTIKEKEISSQRNLGGFDSEEDELYNDARQIVVQSKKASASLLQRRLRVGYARAARLLDVLEENGVVGPADGAKPRDVYEKEEEND